MGSCRLSNNRKAGSQCYLRAEGQFKCRSEHAVVRPKHVCTLAWDETFNKRAEFSIPQVQLQQRLKAETWQIHREFLDIFAYRGCGENSTITNIHLIACHSRLEPGLWIPPQWPICTHFESWQYYYVVKVQPGTGLRWHMHVHDPVALTGQPDLSSPDGHKFLYLC
jgi:hypothetical protein